MNIITAATIDFINHLKAITVGWQIEPLVLLNPANTSDNLIDVARPPRGESFTHYFANYQPTQFTAIRIKIKEQPPYIIQCKLIVDYRQLLELSYWYGNGWLQTKEPCGATKRRRFTRAHTHKNESNVISYHIFKIDRAKKGTKSKGKKRPGKLYVIYCDRIDLGNPEAARIIAEKTVWTFNMAISINVKNSTLPIFIYDDNVEEITNINCKLVKTVYVQ